jgi:hypothetical protein
MLWIRPLMPRLLEKLLLLVALTAAAVGCKPQIGDECQLSTDCSAADDRLCDITAPGGYCTIYNCEPGSCPEDEALCVEFGAQRSPVAACESRQIPSPYARAFCMAVCDSDSDCRDGYTCVDVSRDEAKRKWGALLIDRDRGNRACLAEQRSLPVDPDGEGGVCRTEAERASSGGAPNMSEMPTGGAAGETSGGGASGDGGAAGAAMAGAAGADAGGQGGAGGAGG